MCSVSDSSVESALEQKKFKFSLMRWIQRFLYVNGNLKYKQDLFRCNRMSLGATVNLMRNEETKSAAFDGVVTCGNVWLCPVCSTKIARVRHEEVSKAVSDFHSASSNNLTAMLTLTFSHSSKDSLKSLLALHASASAFFWRSWSVRRIFDDLGLTGRISNYEITCSEINGWHPHKHVLLFLENSSADKLMIAQSQLLICWLNALHHVGLTGNEHALKLDFFRGTTDYLTKLASEMTLSHVKRGRGVFSHYAPFQLADLARNKVAWARSRFLEYALCIKGRSQLHWSRGLKARFGIIDKSDEDVSASVEPSYLKYLTIVGKDYIKLFRHRDLRVLLLDAVAKDDSKKVLSILSLAGVRTVGYFGSSMSADSRYWGRLCPEEDLISACCPLLSHYRFGRVSRDVDRFIIFDDNWKKFNGLLTAQRDFRYYGGWRDV